jgi:phosphatidylserine decarboxylase
VIRIFLSVLDVHVNRSPADGQVTGLEHRPGRFHDARSPQSAVENECQLVTMQLDDGPTIGVRQIAGKVARRIVCDLRPGDRLRRGGRFGMIKFGSGTELILPRAQVAAVHVREGDRVKGGITKLATLAKESR